MEIDFLPYGARGSVIQAFTPSLPTMEFADVSVVLPTNGVYQFKLWDANFIVALVTSRNFQPGGEFNRTRVLFPNAVSVTPGLEYWIEVSALVPTSVPEDHGRVTLIDQYFGGYNSVGRLYLSQFRMSPLGWIRQG